MRRLFDNPFSPFARKVRLVLATKRLPYESVDALAHDVSIWTWPTHRRQVPRPPACSKPGRRDLTEIAARVEASLGEEGFLCGDRLEWLFANGFQAWWSDELHAGRAVVPSWRGEAR